MIEEIDSATYVKHYFEKVLGELGSDPARFLEEAVGFVRAQTDFFSRPGAAATLQHLLAPAAAAPAPAAEAKPAAAAPPAPAGAQATAGAAPEVVAGGAAAPAPAATAAQQRQQEQAPAAEAQAASEGPAAEAEEGQSEEGTKGLKPNDGNGADLPGYSWTQSLQECVLTVPVPPGTKGRACDVQIGRTRLRVGLKGQPPVLDGELFAAVRPDDSLWNLVDGKLLEITLQKVDAMHWWRCVVKGEPEIDTQAVEPENSKLSDLDPEMRATVEKMMYDQRQKALGLPTSEEQAKQEALARFMTAHPEMDFSNAKVV